MLRQLSGPASLQRTHALLRPGVALLAVFGLFACTTSIQLGAPDGSTGNDAPMPDGPLPDAGPPFADANGLDMGPLDETDASLGREGECGFRFEHRSPVDYTHILATSPMDQWLVRGYSQIERLDGMSTIRIALPADAREDYVRQLERSDDGDVWLLTSKRRQPWAARLHRWDDPGWSEILLPDSISNVQVDRVLPFSRNDVWIAAAATSTMHHWNGTTWSAHTLDGRIRGLTRLGSDELMVALENGGRGVRGDWADWRVTFLRGLPGEFRALAPAPEYFTLNRPLFHARQGALEFWVDTLGRVWNGEAWIWTAVGPEEEEFVATVEHVRAYSGRTDVVGVGHYDGAFWIVKKNVALRIVDLTRPELFTVHSLPFEVRSVAFPAEGPPFVVGNGKAFWDGRIWEPIGETPTRLYNQIGVRIYGEYFGTHWGVSHDDYWLGGDLGTAHIHDGVIEYRSPPEDCAPDSLVSLVHGMTPDDMFFGTCHGTQRFYDGAYQEVLFDRRRQLWGHSESSLFALTDNGVERFERGAFTPTAPDDWVGGEVPTYWPARSLVGDADANLYSFAYFSGEGSVVHFDGGSWSRLPALPVPAAAASAGIPIVLYASAGRLWVLGTVEGASGPTARPQTRVWVWDGARWRWKDLDDSGVAWPSAPRNLHMHGAGEELWIVSRERHIWRAGLDGEWQRDDRCVNDPALDDVAFQQIWFPPGGAPKIFGSGGNVLEYSEEPVR